MIARFPNTPYARDASLKLDLVRDHLAGKEMEVGRYYLQRDMYLAAINRFRTVVEQYQTTTHVPEALHRLVEAYLSLGINEEAQAAGAVLGYNYPGSDWYQDTYNLLAIAQSPAEGTRGGVLAAGRLLTAGPRDHADGARHPQRRPDRAADSRLSSRA